MKKLLSVLLVLVLLSGLTVCASAQVTLPFDLVAPANVTAVWQEGRDSPTTCQISYSLSNEMTDFFQKLEEAVADGDPEAFLAPYGFTDLSITTQVDWAVDDVSDSVSGWHYNQYWDYSSTGAGPGYDDEYNIRVGCWDGVDLWVGNATQTVNSHWVTRGVSETELNGDPDAHTPGLKDQLRPSQYSFHDDDLYIDFAQHTLYFRMRFVVIVGVETAEGWDTQYYYSDWSNVAAVGKDAEKVEPVKAGELPAPEITSLRMTDKVFNGNPVAAFTLTVSEELSAMVSRAEALGGSLQVWTECRVKGDTEWIEMQNADWIIRAGEHEVPLLHLVNEERPVISADTPIELRCHYRCYQPEREDLWSEYSQVLTFDTSDITTGGGASTGGVSGTENSGAKSSCPICHFCPQPLGICIFIWLLIILVAVIVVIIVIKRSGKDRKKEDKK